MPLPKRIMLPSEKKRIEKKRQQEQAPSGGVLGGIGKYVRMLGNLLYPNYDELISDLDKAGPKEQDKARTINEGLKSALDFVLNSSTLPPEKAIEEFAQNPNRLNELKQSFAKEDVKNMPSAYGEEMDPPAAGDVDLSTDSPEVALLEELDRGSIDFSATEEVEDKDIEVLEQADDDEEEDLRWRDRESEIGEFGGRLAEVVRFGLEIKRASAGSRKMASGWNSPRLPGRFFRSKTAMIKAAWRETPTQYGRNPSRKSKPGDRSSGWCSKCNKTTSHELLDGGKEKCLEKGCGAILGPVTASKARVVVKVAPVK